MISQTAPEWSHLNLVRRSQLIAALRADFCPIRDTVREAIPNASFAVPGAASRSKSMILLRLLAAPPKRALDDMTDVA
jgi:hypothetical protein